MNSQLFTLILILSFVSLYKCYNRTIETDDTCVLDFLDLINNNILYFDYQNLWTQSIIRCVEQFRNTVISDKLIFRSCDEAICAVTCATQEMTKVRNVYVYLVPIILLTFIFEIY